MIELYIECAGCAEPLQCEMRGTSVIIEPCKNCINHSYWDGYNEGKMIHEVQLEK